MPSIHQKAGSHTLQSECFERRFTVQVIVNKRTETGIFSVSKNNTALIFEAKHTL